MSCARVGAGAAIIKTKGNSAVGDLLDVAGAGGIGDAGAGTAAVVHHAVDTFALLLEAGEDSAFQRAAARQLDAHGIDKAAVDQDFVVHVGAGRHARRSDEADDLALAHALAGLHAFGVSGHVAVGGLVAVVVLDADILAVAAFPADLLDHAVAGGEDRRAVGCGPVDAGVHFHIAEDRVAAAAEARAHDGVVDRLSDQEFFRALAGVVVEIDHGVVGGLEAVVFLGLAADRSE